MFGVGPTELLFWHAALTAIICLVWGRFDAHGQRYQPMERSAYVAGMLAGVGLVLFQPLFASLFTFFFSVVAGLLGYGIGNGRPQGFVEAREIAESPEPPDAPKRVEETGNPYQPPSQ